MTRKEKRERIERRKNYDWRKVLVDIEGHKQKGIHLEFSAFGPGNYHVRFFHEGKVVAHWYPKNGNLWAGSTPINQIEGTYNDVDSVLGKLGLKLDFEMDEYLKLSYT